MLAAIKSGRYTIDYWHGDPRDDHEELDQVYFVRPAIKGNEGVLLDPAYGGECTFFKEGKGCQLPSDGRPFECRNLEPKWKKDGGCKAHTGRREVSIMWIEHQDVLACLVDDDEAFSITDKIHKIFEATIKEAI